MTAIGAVVGLLLSILLIIRKGNPVYSLILGAVVGGLVGGVSLPETTRLMIEGVKDVTPAILRIIAAGVLSGILIVSGAAASIAEGIVTRLGEKRVYGAIALATLILCAIGVFIDVAVITVAPIALAIGGKLNLPKTKLLLAMIGGGKCGNIISPNPNTIIAAENLQAELPEVMLANVPAAVVGFFLVVLIVRWLPVYGDRVTHEGGADHERHLPSVLQSAVGPVVTVLLLALRPLFDIQIDPLIALPCGGLVTMIATRMSMSDAQRGLVFGLEKMSTVAVLLIGTGTIAGIIKNSTLKEVILSALTDLHISERLIAPVAGAVMSGATASTTAGATIASSSFADVILSSGMSAVWGAALINVGATILDHLPHGSFFHATAGAAFVPIKDRLRLIPYESLVGLVLTLLSFLTFILV